MTFTKLRQMVAPVLPLRGGWHMSYFGGLDFIQDKLISFSHQEFNSAEYNNAENILAAIENGKDLYGRTDESLKKIELSDNPYLPEHYLFLEHPW